MPKRLVPIHLMLLVLLLTRPGLAQDEEFTPPVDVDAVIEEPLHQTVPVIGKLVATRSGVVAARTNGPVGVFDIKIGERLAEGQIVASLVSNALEAHWQLWSAEVKQAEAAVTTSRAEMKLNEQEMQRLEDLEGSSAFSPARMDDARQEVAVARSQLAESTAALNVARANLMLAEINLHNADVRAPYDGVVSRRHTEVGAFVTPGSPVFTLIDDATLEIEADVPSERTNGLTPGVTITFTWENGETGTATVRSVVPDENPLTRTRPVRFASDFDSDSVLAINQSVTLHIPSAAPRTVISVHKDAILSTAQGDAVYLAVKGVAERRIVELGLPVGNRFEVLGGLTIGDLVVTRGNERLRPDQKIQYPDAGEQS